MKLKLNFQFQLIAFFALLSLLFTLLVHPLFPPWFEKYKTIITEDISIIPNPEVVYHDFDHDGFSEKVALKFQPNINESAVKIYAYNGGLMNQWTFAERWLPHSTIFGDYDHDGNDEVYVFTQKHDSLFLYAISPMRSKGFLLFRAFILNAPSKVKQWDLRPIAGVWADLNRDRFDDLIINVLAGRALQPRGLFCYDLKNQRLIGQSPESYAFLAMPEIVQVGKTFKILMRGSAALDNAPEDRPYPDNSAWLAVFDSSLQFSFPPIPFNGRGTELQTRPFGRHHENILVLTNYSDKAKKMAQLMLFNWRGNKLLQKELPGNNWNLVQFKEHGLERTILYNGQQGVWTSLKNNLQFNFQKMFDKGAFLHLLNCFDLDNDFEKEFIAQNGRQLIILRNDFSHPAFVNCPEMNWGNLNISLRHNGYSEPQLSIQGGDKKYLIQYAYNPLFPFGITLDAAVFLTFFFSLSGLFYLYSLLHAYGNVVTTLLKNPERGILIFDARGRIRFMNHTLIDQFRLGLTEFKGQLIWNVFEPFSLVKDFFAKLMQTQKAQRKELFITDKNVVLKGEIYGLPITTFFQIPMIYFVEFNDYTRPIESDRLRSWSKTVQKMVHDIKAPLSSISINLMTLNLKLEEIAPTAHSQLEPELALLSNEVDRVKEKTINFLKFTNLEELNFSWVNLKELIEQTLALFESYARKSIHFIVEIEEGIPKIYADERQLKMALQAILENAIDALQAKGTISISVTKAHHVDKNFKDFVEIDIADTGPGIPQEIIGKVFEPYFTTKKEGTGMGLTIAQKIVLEHHGEMQIISSENFSTVVKLILPVNNQINF